MPTQTRQPGEGPKAPKDRPRDTAKPVLLFATGLARAADGVELLLLAGLFRLRFSSLVADPVATLKQGVLVFAGLQSLWAVLCCPPFGHKKGVKPGLWPAILSLILTALTIPVLHVTFVLFGAPLLTHVSETFLCAAALAVLSVFPIFYAHGIDSRAWRSVCGGSAPLDETLGGFWGGIVGAWLGAVPIPLDWDREWQRWPVTIVAGIVAGYIIGRLVGAVALLSKRRAAAGRASGVQGDGSRSKKE